MKNETARREIESLDYYLQNHTTDYSEESHMAMMMAIKALEQTELNPSYNRVKTELEPCEDCISRTEVLDIINFEDEWLFDANSHNADTKIAFSTIKSKISEMPSVTPKASEQQPSREWKEIYAESEGSNSWIEFKCPHCGYSFGMESGEYDWHYGDEIPWKYCPICGGSAEHKPYKAESEIHCNCTDAEIAKSFIEDVEAVKELLPKAESEDKK